MDVVTLRLTLAVVSGVLLVLFYVAAYRPTRAPFSGWWTVSLMLFVLGSLCYLGNGTDAQAVLNPLGNGFGVAGTEAAWYGARSLHVHAPRWPWLLPAPLVAVAAGAVDHPGSDVWAGGFVYLLLMTVFFGLACAELAVAIHRDPEQASLTRALGIVSGVLAAFYAGRALTFEAGGPDSVLFRDGFGSAPTTLLLIVLLVTVSFSMSSLSTQQRLGDLRRRATYDGLTGLLRGQEFRARAPREVAALIAARQPAMLAMADLDHFKKINDQLGHAAGDMALRAFGRAVRSTLGPDALCGRLGGEEFALLFPARNLADAERILATMTATFQRSVRLSDGRIPTVSIGLVPIMPGVSVQELLARADNALYRAKDGGRSRVVRG
jgi:diguanylate cyclase (GGDEF)-like protein